MNVAPGLVLLTPTKGHGTGVSEPGILKRRVMEPP